MPVLAVGDAGQGRRWRWCATAPGAGASRPPACAASLRVRALLGSRVALAGARPAARSRRTSRPIASATGRARGSRRACGCATELPGAGPGRVCVCGIDHSAPRAGAAGRDRCRRSRDDGAATRPNTGRLRALGSSPGRGREARRPGVRGRGRWRPAGRPARPTRRAEACWPAGGKLYRAPPS